MSQIKNIFPIYVTRIVLCLVLAAFGGCADSAKLVTLQSKCDSLQTELESYKADEALQVTRFARFDSLDYDFYSNQKWDQFNQSHADDIKVYYPDGSTTTGLYPQHIDMLKPMFVFAPDTKIKEHPITFGRGDWTCAVGIIEGTFSAPMPIGKGKSIPPTGKTFKLSMATIGRWGADGKMTEEYLFWDNQAFMQQIGLAK